MPMLGARLYFFYVNLNMEAQTPPEKSLALCTHLHGVMSTLHRNRCANLKSLINPSEPYFSAACGVAWRGVAWRGVALHHLTLAQLFCFRQAY